MLSNEINSKKCKSTCNLFESKRPKEEINWAIQRYEIKVKQRTDCIGHIIYAEWWKIVSFLSYVYDMNVSDVLKEAEIIECDKE